MGKEKENEAFRLQSHTYMNDERIGVLIVGADEKVHQELSPVFLVELGDDVLQPPRLALEEEKANALKWRRNSASLSSTAAEDTLPNVVSQLSTAMGHSNTSRSTANSGWPPLSSIKPLKRWRSLGSSLQKQLPSLQRVILIVCFLFLFFIALKRPDNLGHVDSS